MPLIDYPDVEELDTETRQVLSGMELPDGSIPAFGRMLANNPAVLKAAVGQFGVVMFGGGVDLGLKQLAFVTVSLANRSAYCSTTHGQQLVEALGYPAETLEKLARGDSSGLSDEQQAVVELARAAASDPHQVTEEHIEALRGAGFDDAGILELVAAVAQASFANTIAETLHIAPEDEHPGLRQYYPASA